MANGHGGARVPSNPAVVSGPGQLSRRTDGQTQARFTGGPYGEASEMAAIQGGAPMAAAAPAGGGSGGGPDLASLLAGLTPLGAESADPNEPVTAGALLGDGPGPDALGLPMDDVSERAADAKAIPAGQLQAMILASQRPDATPSFRRYVRQLIASR
jgi:hypothetical protein